MTFSSRKLLFVMVVALLLVALLVGCDASNTQKSDAPAPRATSVENASATQSDSLPSTNTPQPTSTFTPAPTATPVPTATLGPTDTPEPTPAPTPDCEALYQEFVATYGQDYTPCRTALRPFDEYCSRPEFLQAADYALNIELILDASGSMAGTVGGQSKLSIAQKTLTDFIDRLPPTGAQVALRVYGHKGSNKKKDRAKSCQGVELLYPFQPLDKEKFKETIRSFSPTGWTPIAHSLRAALDDFQSVDDDANTNVVVLVSDGIETCDGDPVAAAKLLRESELEIVVHVIGFDVDADAAQQLRAVAEAGGGIYFEAHNARDFEKAFVELFNLEEWANYLQCIGSQQKNFELESASKIAQAQLCYWKIKSKESADFLEELANNERYRNCGGYLQNRFAQREAKIDGEIEQIDAWYDFFMEELRRVDTILKELETFYPVP